MSTDPLRDDVFLPTKTAQCHAANLLELPDGTLGCAWFGGTQEGMADIAIWFSRLEPDGWTTPVQVSDDPCHSEQNPVLFAPADAELWVLYTSQHAGNQDSAEVLARVSRDGGYSWSASHPLVPVQPDGGVFVRQPVTVLDDRRWLLPVFRCVRPAHGSWKGDADYSAVCVSDDEGVTWEHHRVPDSTGCVHMNVLQLAGGSYVALFRRRQADAIYRSRSADGVEWSAPEPTDLPNNNSSVQATVLRDGRIVVAYNASNADDATERRTSLYDEIDDHRADTATGPAFWGAPRAPLTLAVSGDGGESWPVRRDLEHGDGYCITNNSVDGLNRELSYPSVTQTRDGAIHVAFTYHRKSIKHVRVDETWFEHRSDAVNTRPDPPPGSTE